MDGAYARARAKSGQTTDKVRGDDLDKYDIEKVRTSIIWYPILLTCVSVVACGWVLHAKVVSLLSEQSFSSQLIVPSTYLSHSFFNLSQGSACSWGSA